MFTNDGSLDYTREKSDGSRGKFQIVSAFHGLPWSTPYDEPYTVVSCGVYLLKGEERDCQYPQKTKCERCPVYNGFMGSERYRLRLQELKSGET